jgi:hypothetical protein
MSLGEVEAANEKRHVRSDDDITAAHRSPVCLNPVRACSIDVDGTRMLEDVPA